MSVLRWIQVGAAALMVTSCAAPSVAPPTGTAPLPPRAESSVQTPADPDACGAQAVQRLVGRLRTEIPVPVLPNLQRVTCTTCAVTMDFNPRRLNFLYDASTGIVREVKCG